jgi:hypothetical protein
MQINKVFFKENFQTKFYINIFDNTYSAVNIRHLQTEFDFLMLGSVSAVVCFFTEIMWHCHRSKGCVNQQVHLSVMDRHT